MQPENQSDQRKRPPHGCSVLVASWAIYALGMGVGWPVRWTTHWERLLSGFVYSSTFLLPVFLVLVLLPTGIVLVLARRRGFSAKAQRIASLLPAVIAGGSFAVWGVVHLESVPERFEKMLGASIPGNAANLSACLSGGGLADHFDWYYLETSREELARLLDSAGFMQSAFEDREQQEFEIRAIGSHPRMQAFEPWTWASAAVYQRPNSRRHKCSAKLVTDAEHRKAMLQVWSY